MYKKPLISILTPVYNQGPYIEDTVHSVLNQTYQNWEWIILDDGSTDGTGDIIKRHKDDRIRYSFQKYVGIDHLTRTYNKALKMCNGELIAMLDSDDYWPEYKLELQVKNFEDPNIVLSYGECNVVNQKGKRISYMSLPDDISIANNNPVGSSLKLFMLKRKCFIANSTIMIRKNDLLNIGGFIEAKGLAQDFPTWTRLSLEGRFSAVPRCLGYWRRHPSSSNLSYNPELLFDAGINFLREFILKNKKKLNYLDFFYDMDSLEKNWEELKKEYITYLPFNKAMLMLRLGLFKEAKTEFKKFLYKDPSKKARLIYSLIALSEIIEIDLVNPTVTLKESLGEFFRQMRLSF